jgi:hypothetical protein
MMVKKVGDRKESSAGRVIDYIQRALDYMQRKNMPEQDRPETFQGNCLTDDIELCKLEIKSTQDQNMRVKGDKTYHMIISYSPEDNDKLTTQFHKKIVADICNELGFGDHQRVCAIHKDTENEHCHVIINKIHPETFKIHSPFQDGPKMNLIAAELEQKYNLTIINHSNEKNEKKNRQKDGIISFNQWVIEEMKESLEDMIKGGAEWKEVADHLATHNLHVRRRGRGLVISDRNKPLFIKSSSVTRAFKELGPLPDGLESAVQATCTYERVPVTGKNPLWDKYQATKEANKAKKAELHKTFRQLRSAMFKEAKLQNLEVKYNKRLRGPAKKSQYINIRDAVTDKLADLDRQMKDELTKHNSGNWLDYLMREYNENGNVEAMEQLKKSKIFNPKFKNIMTGSSTNTEPFVKVDKAGNTYEEVGKSKIFLIDDTLKTQSDELAVATRALEIAMEKFQEPIQVDGSDLFIKAIRLAAEIKGINVKVAGQEVEKEKSKDIEI